MNTKTMKLLPLKMSPPRVVRSYTLDPTWNWSYGFTQKLK